MPSQSLPRPCIVPVLIGLCTWQLLVTAAETVKAPLINEFVFNHTGTDDAEYVGILGAPSPTMATTPCCRWKVTVPEPVASLRC